MTLNMNTTTSANTTNVTNTETALPPTFWNSVLIVVSIFGAGVLVAGAFFFVGGLFGFLFGIPKTVAPPQTTIVVETPGGLQTPPVPKPPTNEVPPNKGRQDQDLYKGNTNLEEISDWLTKIIIGVGLIELTKIPALINQYAEMIAPALGGIPSSGALGIALLVYYSIAGFLFVYVATRAYMESELERIKRMQIQELERVVSIKVMELGNIERQKASASSELTTMEARYRDLVEPK